MKRISFTQSVKEEICHIEDFSIERKKALLSAVLKSSATLGIRDKKYILNMSLKNATIAKFIFSLVKELYSSEVTLKFFTRKNKRIRYDIEINDIAEEILTDLDVSYIENKVPKTIVYNDETISGYLAGLFIINGSLNSPKTSNYHFELSFDNENYAKWVSHLFARYKHLNVEPKMTTRRGRTLLYFKKSDQIANFLLMIGAVNSCMEFENIRIDRDYANSTNRLLNLDVANMSKTVKAGKRQQKEIKYLINKYGELAFKDKKSKLVAQKRLENASYPLEEIASLLNEENENLCITKSNINHIFRKIHQRYLDETNN